MVLIKNSEPCSDNREVNKPRNKKGTYTKSWWRVFQKNIVLAIDKMLMLLLS
jgi:hypothetical protein